MVVDNVGVSIDSDEGVVLFQHIRIASGGTALHLNGSSAFASVVDGEFTSWGSIAVRVVNGDAHVTGCRFGARECMPITGMKLFGVTNMHSVLLLLLVCTRG